MKHKRIFSTITVTAAIISLSLLFSGCSHFQPAENHKTTLNQAINAEWTAKINKDWGIVYDLATQSFKKEINRDDFIKYANVEVLNYKIKGVQIEPDGETAIAVIDYTAFQMGFQIPMKAKETWVKENGKWRMEMPPGIQSPIGSNK